MLGEVEGNSLGVLDRGGAKVKNETLGMFLQQPSSVSVQDLLRGFALFVFQGCYVLESGTSVVWASFVTTLPSPEFPPNKMVWFVLSEQYLVRSRSWRSRSPWGWTTGNTSKNKFSFCNTYLFISNVRARVLVCSSLLCLQIGWPTTARTLWTSVAPTTMQRGSKFEGPAAPAPTDTYV